MGVGQIVDQNSDEKDGCEVSNILNSNQDYEVDNEKKMGVL